MPAFDYEAPAEVFVRKAIGGTTHIVTYRLFHEGAEAVRFAMEELSSNVWHMTAIEQGYERFDFENIQALYDSPAYPLRTR